ncbi:ABC transporter permease [Rhizobium sp. PAMB 3174]
MNQAKFRLGLAWRLASRELRGGLKGFYIFLACIALGTAAIAAVNSISGAITGSISSQGRDLLGADLRFELNNREASSDELDYLQSLGDVAVSTGTRSMARKADGSDQSLVEVKAVDDAYPLYGKLETTPSEPVAQLLSEKDGSYGAIAAPILLDRLGLKVGDPLLLGELKLVVAARLDNEPDALSEGFGFAPRLIVSRQALSVSGLVQTGSLVETAYKVKLPPGHAPLARIIDAAKAKFPDAGWSIRSSANATPALTNNIERFTQFLTLVGLTALIVGGAGVANAVRAFLDSKRTTIATFKCLGAPASVVVMIYLIQIMMIATVGVLVGLVIGAIAPFIALKFLAGILPVSGEAALYPSALAIAAVFGYLTTLAFAILPLGQTREIPATALFREQGFEGRRWPSWPYLAVATASLLALAGLALLMADDRFIAGVFIVATACAFVVLRAVAAGIAAIARRAPIVSSPALRLAIGNIHRPGALTSPVVLSLGLGLALLVTLTMIDGNLRRELTGKIPDQAPNFFFVGIQASEIDAFRTLVKEKAPEGKLMEVPMLRGRIMAFNGEDVAKMNVPPGGRWVLRGDRGITYADALPENSTLTEGKWWAPDYAGEPLVSFSADEARDLGLKLGDTVTVNVLGRNITAKIANFRDVEWQSLSINFVMVFSPNTFRGAPHGWIATLTDAGASGTEEASIMREVTNTFPAVTTVRVKDALDLVNKLAGQIATAIRAAAAFALVASILVLAGALAAGNRARTHDAVVLKTLGAKRTTLIRAFTYEYLILGVATAVFALLAGTAASWYVVEQIMHLNAVFLPEAAIATLVIALVVTIGVGLAGTWSVLGKKPASVLREL